MKRTASNSAFFDDINTLRNRSQTSLSVVSQGSGQEEQQEMVDEDADFDPNEVVATGVLSRAIPSSETKPPELTPSKIAQQLKSETKNFVKALSDLKPSSLSIDSLLPNPTLTIVETEVNFVVTIKKIPGQSLGMGLTAAVPEILIRFLPFFFLSFLWNLSYF